MSTMSLVVVTPERVIYSDIVNAVVAPGIDGQLGILPYHAPLMTILQSGELRIRKDNEEFHLAIFGGFLEVRPDSVMVLADAAERSDEIDEVQAEEIKCCAEQALADCSTSGSDKTLAEIALCHSLVRLKVINNDREKRKRKSGIWVSKDQI